MLSTTDINLIDDERKKIYNEVDPPPQAKTTCQKVTMALIYIPLLVAVFAFPFVEDYLRNNTSWGYKATKFAGFPQMYGLTIIFALVLPNFVLVYIGFAMTGKGRQTFGYKNPVHYASVDIHVEDVLSGGKVLSNGDLELSRKKLKSAVNYSCYQRTHGNTLEWFPTFLSLALFGGILYPAAAAFWGLLWSISRVVWARGYATGNPIDRYSHVLGTAHWLSTLGCFALAIGTASNLLQQ
jgi:hypothetical protein